MVMSKNNNYLFTYGYKWSSAKPVQLAKASFTNVFAYIYPGALVYMISELHNAPITCA